MRSSEVLSVMEGFIAKHDTWEREKDLENAKEVIVKFKGRMNVEVR